MHNLPYEFSFLIYGLLFFKDSQFKNFWRGKPTMHKKARNRNRAFAWLGCAMPPKGNDSGIGKRAIAVAR